MVSTCQGCEAEVDLDLGKGEVRGPDGSTEDIEYADRSLVVWNCPLCEYPHADQVH